MSKTIARILLCVIGIGFIAFVLGILPLAILHISTGFVLLVDGVVVGGIGLFSFIEWLVKRAI